MTGHVIVQTQTPTFLTTLQATLDILDDISGRIDENTYLTLANNLQQLHNIHTSNPTSNPTSYANPPITTPINYTRTDYVSTISYASIRNFNISNANTTNIINDIINNNNNANNTNINNNEYRNIQSLNEETNRMNYSTRTRLILYGNALNNDAN